MGKKRYEREYVGVSPETKRAHYRIIDTETLKVVEEGNGWFTESEVDRYNKAAEEGWNPRFLYGKE